MNADRSLYGKIEKSSFQVTAHVLSRLLQRDIHSELDRLRELPKSRSYVEVGSVIAVLLGLAFAGASFGVWGLFVYFAIMFFVFR